MARALLFTGAKKVGKTTAVRNIATRLGSERFVGFFAIEQRIDGQRVGFDIEMMDGRTGPLASIDSTSDMRVGRILKDGRGKYGVDLDFLNDVAVPALRSAVSEQHTERVLLIDEIGAMQLYSEPFRQLVLEALTSSCLLLGTLMLPSEPWVDTLKARDDVETFLLTPQNRNSMTEMMSLYLERCLIPLSADHVAL
ncbi:MAG: nucleoside-triphosphatase [Pseudonocardiaceae bacterium]